MSNGMQIYRNTKYRPDSEHIMDHPSTSFNITNNKLFMYMITDMHYLLFVKPALISSRHQTKQNKSVNPDSLTDFSL